MQTNNIEIILPKCGICTLDRRFFQTRQNLYLQSQLPPSPLLPPHKRSLQEAREYKYNKTASFFLFPFCYMKISAQKIIQSFFLLRYRYLFILLLFV